MERSPHASRGLGKMGKLGEYRFDGLLGQPKTRRKGWAWQSQAGVLQEDRKSAREPRATPVSPGL